MAASGGGGDGGGSLTLSKLMSETESRLSEAENRFQDLSKSRNGTGEPYQYKSTSYHGTSASPAAGAGLAKGNSADGEAVLKYKDDGLVEAPQTIKPFQTQPLGK